MIDLKRIAREFLEGMESPKIPHDIKASTAGYGGLLTREQEERNLALEEHEKHNREKLQQLTKKYPHFTPTQRETLAKELSKEAARRELPRSEAVLESLRSSGWKNIDKEIRGLVIELNDSGYTTMGSCAGHGGRGFITFVADQMTPEARKDVESIFSRYGIKIKHWRETVATPIDKTYWGDIRIPSGDIFAEFKPLVKPLIRPKGKL